MKRTVLSTMIGLCLAASVTGQRVNGRFVTSVYAWQRDDTVGVQRTLVLGYQTMQFDMYQKDISLHANLQGFNDFGFNVVGLPQVSSGPQVRFYNLYIKASRIANVLDLSFGRQPVYAGVGNGTIDGLLSRLQFAEGKAAIVGYAGAVPPPFQKAALVENIDKNFMLGGQVVATPVPEARLALSYMNRRVEQSPYFAVRRDSLNNALGVYVTPEPFSEQFVGIDASYRRAASVYVYGRYEYDLNYEQISRGQAFGRVSVTDKLALTGEYIYRSPRLPFHSFFSIFPRNSVKELEGGVEYTITPLCRAFGKVAKVWYVDDDTRRYSAGLGSEYGSMMYSGSVGYGGKLNSFSAQVYYPLLERILVPSAGVSWAEYRLSREAPVEHTTAALLGSTFRPVPSVAFDVQLQWLKNRIVKNDLRFFLKLNYWFTEQLNLFK
jgi:hypothetical protein